MESESDDGGIAAGNENPVGWPTDVVAVNPRTSTVITAADHRGPVGIRVGTGVWETKEKKGERPYI